VETEKKTRPFLPIRSLVGSFLIMIAIGTILLWLPWASSDGKSLPLLDSLFTSTSAVCVTGLIVRDTPTHFSAFGEIVILLLLQAGGIGILTYTSLFAVMMGRRIRYKKLSLMKESLGAVSAHSVIDLLKLVIMFTFAIEIIGALLLIPSFARDASGIKAVYLAVFHSASAFCNAGFSLFSDSFRSFRGDLLLNFVICSLIIIGGIGFPVIADIFENRRYSKLSLYSKLVIRITLWLIVIGWGLIYLFESRVNPDFWLMNAPERLLTTLFQSITARTAGFNTLDIGMMSTPALMIIICLMFIGGSPGGTAGGIKTTTFALAAKAGFVFMTGRREVNIAGRRVSQASQFRAGGLAFFAVMVLVVSVTLLTALSGMSLRDAAFEAASAFGTVGLSTGVTGGLNSMQKVLIIVLMFVGRIGPVSLALSLGFREKGELAHRPEIDVLTG
jgi:trk system potassium uptake protein TrkH